MKTMRKVFALLLVLVMTMGLCMTASAAKITITGGSSGSTYVAYKLLNATEVPVEGQQSKWTYTVNSTYATALKTVTGATTDEGILSAIEALRNEGSNVQGFADKVYEQVKNMDPDAESTNGVFNPVDAGYYLIVQTKTHDSGAYSLVMLDTAGTKDVTVGTKERTPELVKKVMDKNDSKEASNGGKSGWQDAADYDVGDLVPFQITCTFPENFGSYSSYNMTIHDKLSSGLVLSSGGSNEQIVKVYLKASKETADKDRVELSADNDYTLKEIEKEHSSCSFEITLNTTGGKTKSGQQITATSIIQVEYTAKLTGDSVIGKAGNPNEAWMKYSNNPYGDGTGETPHDKVTVFTYRLVVNKVDEDNNALAGAGFTLYKYDASQNGYIEVEKKEAGTTTTFTFERLDAGKYKLVETEVPDGHKKAEDLIFWVETTFNTDSADPQFESLKIYNEGGDSIGGTEFTVDDTDGSYSMVTNIVNQAGIELPSTGGIGTTIFYVVGGIMVAGAAILLITKKRMDGDKK